MGSGNSRLKATEGEGVHVKIQSLLSKNKNGAMLPVEGTLSKKQLLKNDEEEDQSRSSRETETEDKVSLEETQTDKEETAVQVITVEKLSRVVPMHDVECETVEEKDRDNVNTEQGNKEKDHEQEKVKHVDEKAKAEVKTGEGKNAEQKPENEHEEVDAKDGNDDDTDDDDDSEEIGRLICPGSPSFRIYCIEAEKKKEEECKNQTIVVHQKTLSADSVENTASNEGSYQTIVVHQKSPSADSIESRNLGNTNEVAEIESTTKRKGKKMKKFKTMKNLINVKSCYYPMCTCAGTGDDRNHIIAAKAAN